MANKNTNPGIGKVAVPEVMNSADSSRVRTRTRGMSYGDINNIPLVVIPRACAHAREENGKPHSEAALAQWRTKTFGGDFDPVRVAVDEAVSAFSMRQPEDDRRIWLKIANEIGYEAFRDLYLEQCAIMREYKLRNPSAAFQNRLNRYTGHNSNKRRHGINEAKHSEACEKANAEVVQSEEERIAARMTEEVARMEKAIEGMTPDEVYGYCRKLEDDREFAKLRYPKGRFHASMLSVDQLVDSFEDPSKIQVFTDDGEGSNNVLRADASNTIAHALNSLSPKERAFVQDVFNGKKWEEIGISESTFYRLMKKVENIFRNIDSPPSKTVV